MLFSWKVFQGEKHIFRFNSYSTFSGWVLKRKYPQMGTHINARHRRLDARRAVYHQFHQFLIAWVPTVKLDMFTRQTLVRKCSVRNLLYWDTHTYHWIQLAKRMEYWQKFSFITSFSKGLIGYSLRYLGEREAAECMSGVVGRVGGVQGGVQGEELRTRQKGENIKDAEGEDSTYCAQAKAGTCDTLGS